MKDKMEDEMEGFIAMGLFAGLVAVEAALQLTTLPYRLCRYWLTGKDCRTQYLDFFRR